MRDESRAKHGKDGDEQVAHRFSTTEDNNAAHIHTLTARLLTLNVPSRMVPVTSTFAPSSKNVDGTRPV